MADLRGSWTRARTDLPVASRAQNTYLTNRASNAINVRYDGGRVIGRDGFLAGLAATGKMTMMYQWFAYSTSVTGAGAPQNFLVTFENGAIRYRNLYFHYETTAEAIAGAYGATVVEAGDRLYVALYSPGPVGATETRILFPFAGEGFDSISNAFMGPMSEVPTFTEPFAGLVTAGLHKWGYIVTSRSGSQLKPSPYSAAIFTPPSFTAAGDTTVQMQVSAVWPDDAMFVSPIMTTIENLEKFFIVPGMELSVIPGMLYPVQFQISITDEVLEATATELTDNFGYMTQYTDGTGPFKPFNLAQLGRRIAYFVENKVYISDQDDYERVTEDQHVLQLPGERYVVTACQIRGVNYFFGPKWTYAAVDNEDVPVLWAAPYAVSLGQGTSAVHGVCVNTTGDMAWVANEYGLWDFGGGYDAIPVSDMNEPEWRRINWGQAQTTMWIVDDPIAQTVMVFAPLDGATENTHRLTWSYSRGRGPTQVDFSLDTLPAASACMVREQTSQRSRLWLGPNASTTPILVEDSVAFDDNGKPIVSIWESGEVFKRRHEASSIDMKVHAVEAKAKGIGILRTRVYEASRNLFEDLATNDLKELPRDAIEMGCDVMSHDATVEFKTTGLGERLDLNDFTVFYMPWLTGR